MSSVMVWRGPVTGLSYHGYGRFVNDLVVGVHLQLRRVKNEFDSRAVGVFFKGDQIGWIPKQQNQDVSQALDQGKELMATITSHTLDSVFSTRLYINVFSLTQQIQPQEPQMINKLIESNKKAVVSASFLEAGRISNNQLNKLVAKKLPIMVRGYADTTLGRVVLANLAQMALENFRPQDPKATRLGQAMVTEAYGQLIQEFNIEEILADLLKSSGVAKALTKLEVAQVAETD